MADERLRRLERAAASGDREAAERFRHEKARTVIRPPPPPVGMVFSVQEMAASIQEAVAACSTFAHATMASYHEFSQQLEDLKHIWSLPSSGYSPSEGPRQDRPDQDSSTTEGSA